MDMEQTVQLTLTTAHRYADSEDDRIDLITDGLMRSLGEGWELEYQESELTDMGETLTSILIQGEQVTLIRTGPINSQMVFQQGRRHHSVYATLYGKLEIAVSTQRLENHITAQGGVLEIDYTLEADHALIDSVAFRLAVRVKE